MVSITLDAAEKLRRMIAKENPGKEIPETAGLRIWVKAGGCSEFQYCLELEAAPKKGDVGFESNGVRIFVESRSVPYLDGAEISRERDLTKGINLFKITNPNTQSTCGCGKSFEPK